MENKIREFKLTTLALKNKTSVLILTLLIMLIGLMSYKMLPKELFPEVNMPYVMVQVAYPGNNPSDIENLVTRPLEKEIDGIKGIKKISSTSMQDLSMISIEFNFDVAIKDALQDVKDAVDKARSDLPNDLPQEPLVQDLDFSEFPIININITGDYSLSELKQYADDIEEELSGVKEISKVNIQGISDKEVKIHIDADKMAAFELALRDIEQAISQENLTIGGGQLKLGGTRRSVRIIGEYTSMEQIRNTIVKNENGHIVYLKDLATVEYAYEEPKSISRLGTTPVLSLQVIKKSGENTLDASDNVNKVLEKMRREGSLPEDLQVVNTNDQSGMIKKQLNNLENSMIMSMLFVVIVLFFFLGTRNALFVGLAIPLSMFLSFVVLGALDYRINMMVLFGLILALGMLVDNAIVVVENIYRFHTEGHSKYESAKRAVGEVAVPIIASTATTLAAFVPLLFWDDITGEFMKYLPVTLIIVLSSSLFVALVINPVVSSSLIKRGEEKVVRKRGFKIGFALWILSIPFYFLQSYLVANLLFIAGFVTFMNVLFFNRLAQWFRSVFLVKLEQVYANTLRKSVTGKTPYWILAGSFLLLAFTVVLMAVRAPKVEFFPSADPNHINVKLELPIGTDISTTDAYTRKIYNRVVELVGADSLILKSIVSNVGEGAVADGDMGGHMGQEYQGLVTLSFVDYELRGDRSSADVMKRLSDALIGQYAGVKISISKEANGPPTGKPINLEISGKDYDKLINLSDTIIAIINAKNIPGIEGLKMDLDLGKPEMLVHIDRDAARRFGMSTGMIASSIRTALFGKEISDYKDGEEEYPIQLRLQDKFRYNVPNLMNMKLKFRNNMGQLMNIPISSVASFSYSTTYGAVKRIDLDRVITVYSNVLEGYNANEINAELAQILDKNRKLFPEGYKYQFTGEQKAQEESMAFLSTAFSLAIAMILLILVSQFNSLIKPIIILTSVLLSTIGVFGGIATFKMDIFVIMTGVGIVSLAGVVVNNAIVLIDYIDLLKTQRRKALGLQERQMLPPDEAIECIIQGGKTRLRPVLLTAITTILGLFPMAIGINIDFEGLLNDFNPNIFFGGDMAEIWSPLSWTVIFGLTFATFLTLIIVPAMYRIVNSLQLFFSRKLNW